MITMENDNTQRNLITKILVFLAIGVMAYYLFVTVPYDVQKNNEYLKTEIKRLDSLNLKYNIKLDSLANLRSEVIIKKETIIKNEIHEKEIVKEYNDSASVIYFTDYINEYLRTINRTKDTTTITTTISN